MQGFKYALFAMALALGIRPGIAIAQFSNIYVFGDSLSDNGSFKPVLPPRSGLFTTNPGPIWVQVFADRFGFQAKPANQGGNDYAEGGARAISSYSTCPMWARPRSASVRASRRRSPRCRAFTTAR